MAIDKTSNEINSIVDKLSSTDISNLYLNPKIPEKKLKVAQEAYGKGFNFAG